MKIILGSALLACALAVPAHADDCKHTAHRTANSAGPDIERVVIEAKAGDLVVRGAESRDVTVEGRACASTAELLEESKLEIRRDGNTVYVRTVLPDIHDSLFGCDRYAYMDVKVGVPATATLKIDDSSGDMEVTDVQAATIVDSTATGTAAMTTVRHASPRRPNACCSDTARTIPLFVPRRSTWLAIVKMPTAWKKRPVP